MTGGSTDGTSRTPRRVKPMAPKSRIVNDMTIASTGRRMESE
jgi:hypothetical protein